MFNYLRQKNYLIAMYILVKAPLQALDNQSLDNRGCTVVTDMTGLVPYLGYLSTSRCSLLSEYYGLAVASPYVGIVRFQNGGSNKHLHGDNRRAAKLMLVFTST